MAGEHDRSAFSSEVEGYLDQLLSIVQDTPGIVNGLTEAEFYWRPRADAWSIGECFQHLNLTAGKFAGSIEASVNQARKEGVLSPGPFAYSLLERLFVRSMEPPPRLRVRARAGFQPDGTQSRALAPDSSAVGRPSPDVVMAEFGSWQDRFGELLRMADGVDLRRARLKSPVLPLFTYSLGTCFAAMLAHERRHIWQARQVRNHPLFPKNETAASRDREAAVGVRPSR